MTTPSAEDLAAVVEFLPGPYSVQQHELRAGGEHRTWSEVRRTESRPGLGRHVAHCPEHDDAVMIADALNAYHRARAALASTEVAR